MECSAYSSILTTEVDAPFTTSKEGNYDSRFRRAIRFDFGPGASSRPSQIKYEARTTKTYSQRYSDSVSSVYIKHLNLSQITKGVIDLTWDSKGSITSVSITGDMPPSVDEYGTFRTVNIPGQGQRWTYVTNGNLISERYETQLSGSFSETSELGRLELSKMKLGFVSLGKTTASTFFDLAPDGKPSVIELPAAETCETIPKTNLNLGVLISDDQKGRIGGRLIGGSVSCGSSSDPTEPNGKLSLNGKLVVQDKNGKEIELLGAVIEASVTNKQRSLIIDGSLALIDRPPIKLVMTGTEIAASSAANSSQERFTLKYDQGGFSMTFDSLSTFDPSGRETSSEVSMNATGGIAIIMKQSDRKLDVKHNGKLIGLLDMNTKKVQFSDGSYEYLR